MNDLSVTIITLNEEKKISQCLKSVQDLDAEIILIDSGSTDQTLEIAKKYQTKIFHRDFDNFANQKSWAASKATKNWILSVDADEIITSELAREIKQAIKNQYYSGFLIPRRNFILGAEIKHTRWSPDKHIWLWRKESGKWVGEVHEEVFVDGKIGELRHSKIHNQQETIEDFIKGNDFYSGLLAKKMVIQGIKFSIWKLWWDPVYEFILRYFYKRGFLDGWRGFVLSYLMAFYKITFWVKVWELENDKK